MENEREENINEKMILNSENAFKKEYNGQSLKKNSKFIDWKNRMLSMYGNDAKLFYCKDDNINFYGTNDDCKSFPYYKSKCPICKKSICYYCSRFTHDICDRGTCCIKRRVYCIFVQDGFSVINPKNPKDGEIGWRIKIFLTPILSFMYFVAYFSIVFYYKLSIANVEKNDGYYGIYEGAIKKSHCLFFCIIGFNVAFAFALSISFLILDTYLKILILLISFPFKMYPIKYYFGIMFEGLRGSL